MTAIKNSTVVTLFRRKGTQSGDEDEPLHTLKPFYLWARLGYVIGDRQTSPKKGGAGGGGNKKTRHLQLSITVKPNFMFIYIFYMQYSSI